MVLSWPSLVLHLWYAWHSERDQQWLSSRSWRPLHQKHLPEASFPRCLLLNQKTISFRTGNATALVYTPSSRGRVSVSIASCEHLSRKVSISSLFYIVEKVDAMNCENIFMTAYRPFEADSLLFVSKFLDLTDIPPLLHTSLLHTTTEVSKCDMWRTASFLTTPKCE